MLSPPEPHSPLIGNFPQIPAERSSLKRFSAVKFHLPMIRFLRWVGVMCLTRQNLHWTPFFVRSIMRVGKSWAAVMDIVVWLRSLGLGQYEAAFRENEINERVLPSLTRQAPQGGAGAR